MEEWNIPPLCIIGSSRRREFSIQAVLDNVKSPQAPDDANPGMFGLSHRQRPPVKQGSQTQAQLHLRDTPWRCAPCHRKKPVLRMESSYYGKLFTLSTHGGSRWLRQCHQQQRQWKRYGI